MRGPGLPLELKQSIALAETLEREESARRRTRFVDLGGDALLDLLAPTTTRGGDA